MKLKWEAGQVQSPLGRARGLGSSGEGVHHWIDQRITAIANLFLVSWMVCAVVCTLAGSDYETFSGWLAQPLNAILMILSVISVFYHAALGVQVVVEDYIHHEGFKMLKLIGVKLFFFAAAVACIFSILKVAFA